MRFPLMLAAFLTLVIPPAALHAQAAPPESALDGHLTDRHRIMLGGSLSGSWSNDEELRGQRTFPDWSVDLWPSATYFVFDRVGFGLSGGGGFEEKQWVEVNDKKRYAGGFAHALFDLRLSDRLSLIPMLFTGFLREWTERRSRQDSFSATGSAQGAVIQQQSPFPRIDFHQDLWRTIVQVPLVFHASSSVAIGLGPSFLFDYFLEPRPQRKVFTLRQLGPYGAVEDEPEEDSLVTRTSRLRVGVSTWIGASF